MSGRGEIVQTLARPCSTNHLLLGGRCVCSLTCQSLSRGYTPGVYFPSSLSCPSLLLAHGVSKTLSKTDKWRERIRKHCRGNDIEVVPRMFFLLQRNGIAAVTFSWVHRGVWWAWRLKSCSPVEEVPRGLEYPRHSQSQHIVRDHIQVPNHFCLFSRIPPPPGRPLRGKDTND